MVFYILPLHFTKTCKHLSKLLLFFINTLNNTFKEYRSSQCLHHKQCSNINHLSISNVCYYKYYCNDYPCPLRFLAALFLLCFIHLLYYIVL